MKSKNDIKIAPSILSGDFGYLADEAKRIEDSGADLLHIDIMDGHFVPNLTLGPRAVAAINRATNMFLEVHLMIYNPFDYIERFVEAGADRIIFHFEATEDVDETIQYIRKCGIKAGLAFCPETSMSMVTNFLTKCDAILLMTVHPGFGGQEFMPEVLDKIRFTRETCNRLDIRQGGVVVKDTKKAHSGKGEELIPPLDIEVDGGINLETACACYEAGANVFVSGTYLFEQPNLTEAVRVMRETIAAI